MRSDYTQAYINRGDILIKLNRTKEAQEVYERALLYDSSNPDIYYNVSTIHNFKFIENKSEAFNLSIKSCNIELHIDTMDLLEIFYTFLSLWSAKLLKNFSLLPSHLFHFPIFHCLILTNNSSRSGKSTYNEKRFLLLVA